MLLHAVHDNAVVLKRVTGVIQGVGVQTSLILPMPQVQQQNQESLLELVELEEEELVHDSSLRRVYGEVCVSDEEGGDCGFVGADVDEDDSELLSLTSHTPLSRIHIIHQPLVYMQKPSLL